MTRRYGHGDHHETQAQQMWIILAGCAAFGPDLSGKGPGRVTYGDLAELMGRDRSEAITLSRPLGILGAWCAKNGLPAINSLVVNQETGEPGDEVVLREGRSAAQEQDAARRQRWHELHPPREDELLEVAEAA